MNAPILNKEDRLAYIKEAAIRAQEEKRRARILYETDTEMSEEFGVDTDFMSISEVSGVTLAGVQKVQGGVRYVPVHIY
jgi:hypothetical protein